MKIKILLTFDIAQEYIDKVKAEGVEEKDIPAIMNHSMQAPAQDFAKTLPGCSITCELYEEKYATLLPLSALKSKCYLGGI